MPSPDVIFRQLFLICAASFLCEILAENAHTSSSKGLHAALKTVCALCVCVTFFSLFGDSGTFEADISSAFDSVPNVVDTAPADGAPDNADGLSAVIERTQTGSRRTHFRCHLRKIRHKTRKRVHRLDCKQAKRRNSGIRCRCFAVVRRTMRAGNP